MEEKKEDEEVSGDRGKEKTDRFRDFFVFYYIIFSRHLFLHIVQKNLRKKNQCVALSPPFFFPSDLFLLKGFF